MQSALLLGRSGKNQWAAVSPTSCDIMHTTDRYTHNVLIEKRASGVNFGGYEIGDWSEMATLPRKALFKRLFEDQL